MDDFYTLIKLIKELRLDNEVARELRIKPSSFRRQINRIEAYLEGREAQKRSGRRRGEEYKDAMKRVIERHLGRPVRTGETGARRKMKFPDLKDALRYSEPIPHISRLKKNPEDDEWMLEIDDDSMLG